MKTTSRYFLFFTISLVLYAFIFLYFEQRLIIKPLPLNSGEQAIKLHFVSQPAEIKMPAEPVLKQETEQETAPAQMERRKVITEQMDSSTLSESEVKLRKQALLDNIAKTTAESAAELKAALFDEQLNPKKIAASETEPVTEVKTIRKLIPQDKAAASNTAAPPANKEVIKKQPQVDPSSKTLSALNQGVLQQAIVVSGHKPVYPQRAILRNQQGRVVVKLTVTSQGKPKNPNILTSSGYSILDQAVLAFVRQELFMPALQGQERVTSEQLFAFRFELN
ncbi:MAG TPA: TonB family protein [Psychromonas sp.]